MATTTALRDRALAAWHEREAEQAAHTDAERAERAESLMADGRAVLVRFLEEIDAPAGPASVRVGRLEPERGTVEFTAGGLAFRWADAGQAFGPSGWLHLLADEPTPARPLVPLGYETQSSPAAGNLASAGPLALARLGELLENGVPWGPALPAPATADSCPATRASSAAWRVEKVRGTVELANVLCQLEADEYRPWRLEGDCTHGYVVVAYLRGAEPF